MDKKLFKVFVLGILVRFIFMVSSCHFDLLSYYWYAHFLPYHGGFPSDLFSGIGSFIPGIFIHSLWLFVIRPLLNGGIDFWPHAWFIQHQNNGVNLYTWVQFVSQGNIAWVLFLFKLPYLVIELLMVRLILKMLPDYKSKYLVLIFLMFNPVSLFITYIFGAHDIILVFFLVLSLYLVKRQRIYLGALFLGFSVFFKLYSIFLVPLFVFLIEKEWLNRIKLTLCIFSLSIFYFIFLLFKGKLFISLDLISRGPHFSYMLSLAWPFEHGIDRIYPFVLAYCITILYVVYGYKRSSLYDDLAKFSLVLSLLFFALSFFHPQYFLMVVPLMALQIGKNRGLMPLFFVQSVCFFVYTFQWGRDLFGHLFMPLNPNFFIAIRSPSEFINQFYPSDKFFGIFRSIFSAVSFWMMFLLLKKRDISAQLEEAQ